MKVSTNVKTDWYSRKVIHLVVYAALCASFYRATQHAGISLGLSTTYGILDELHQKLTPHRSGMIMDMYIDFAGAFIMALIIWKFYRKLPQILKSWLRP